VVHRLVQRAHVPRVDPRGHGLHALAVTGQQETGQVSLERLVPVGVTDDGTKAIGVLVESSGGGRPLLPFHADIIAGSMTAVYFSDTVVLAHEN
jgi:hypothetical protein